MGLSAVYIYWPFVLIALSVLLLVAGWYQLFFQPHQLISERAKTFVHADRQGKNRVLTRQEELSLPLWERLGRPLLQLIAGLARRLLPATKHAALENLLILAGRPGKLTPVEVVALKYLLAIAGGSLFSFIAAFASIGPVRGGTLFLLGLIGGWLTPEFYLKRKAAERREEAIATLPDVLDLLTISVEAGTGFDGAMAKVVEKGRGIWALEFYQALREIQMGKPRREALRDMSKRINVEDFSEFIAAIVMADQLGLPIARVLRLQAEQLRRKRRQRAEEQAMKAPVKMLLPLVLFIFPAVFVVLLGPAVIRIIETFGKQ